MTRADSAEAAGAFVVGGWDRGDRPQKHAGGLAKGNAGTLQTLPANFSGPKFGYWPREAWPACTT
jgi:hypothetical protein